MKFLNYISQLTTHGLQLVILAVAWMAGILADRIFQVPPELCLLLSGLATLLLIIFRHNQRDAMPLLVTLFIGLGAWRYAYAQAQLQHDLQSLKRFIDTSTSVGIRGVVVDEPKVQTRTRLLMISVDAVQHTESAQWEKANGTI